MKKKKIRLKRILDWSENYHHSICVAARCQNYSEIILATKEIAPVDVGLCGFHWIKYCEE